MENLKVKHEADTLDVAFGITNERIGELVDQAEEVAQETSNKAEGLDRIINDDSTNDHEKILVTHFWTVMTANPFAGAGGLGALFAQMAEEGAEDDGDNVNDALNQ